MNAATQTDESIELEFDVDEPPERVWQALTERELVDRWLTPNGKLIEREVLESVPNERLSWRQIERDEEESFVVESTVIFELDRTDEGTHVRLSQTGFEMYETVCMLRAA